MRECAVDDCILSFSIFAWVCRPRVENFVWVFSFWFSTTVIHFSIVLEFFQVVAFSPFYFFSRPDRFLFQVIKRSCVATLPNIHDKPSCFSGVCLESMWSSRPCASAMYRTASNNVDGIISSVSPSTIVAVVRRYEASFDNGRASIAVFFGPVCCV